MDEHKTEAGAAHTRRAWDHAKGDVLAFQQLTLPDKCDECDVIWPCPSIRDLGTPPDPPTRPAANQEPGA